MTVRKKATVAFLGGSITEMDGWKEMVKDDLGQRFPDTEFTFIDAGISSLGSTPHAFRFQEDVLAKGVPDLLFVEAAVNDHTNFSYSFISSTTRSFHYWTAERYQMSSSIMRGSPTTTILTQLIWHLRSRPE